MKKFSELTNETYADSGIGKWMKQSAGGEPGWDRYNTSGERAGKCGDAEDGDAYSACLSPEKAKKLGKDGIASFVRRKRDAQKKAGDSAKGGEEKKGQKPVFVKTKANEETLHEKNVPLNPALWDKAIAKAKSKFDVYPSAYANAWASKWYKGEGGKWTTKKESVEDCGCDELSETSGEYEGKEVDLDNPFRLPQGSKKKFGVYVKNPKTGNVIMVKFGDPNLSIKRDSPDRLKNFRARHNCDQKTDKTTPGYWSCKFWEKDSPVSKLLSKGDVTEDSQLDEGIDSLKGWVNPKTKKSYMTRKMRPYHVEFIVKKPTDFGLTRKKILDYLKKHFDAMDAPDPEESAKFEYQDILSGRSDIHRGIELLAMEKGWYRVVGGKFSSIAGENKLNDKQIGVILDMMEDEGIIGDASDVYTQEVGLEYYEDQGIDTPPRVKYYGEIKGSEIQNLIKGKPRGAKRTEIGQTMAMFRGESLEISQLDEAVDPKDMLRIFNDLNKGDSIKVKFKSVMATASKNFVELVVTSGRRTVGKAKVERIILKSKKNPGGVKYFLYRRGDKVSFAMGDMAAIIDQIDESYQMVQEGIKDKLVKKLLDMTPVAKLVARNPQTTHLAMSLLAIPAVNRILDRANYDNLQKVIDIAEFMKDTVATLGAEKDPSMCESKSVELTEGKFGHTLWIDPKGKVYDMNDRKEITHPKGHPYTHYDWVAANFTKYFGKTAPDDMGRVVYDAPHEKGWARVRNNPREIDVEVNLSKLTRSQKKTLQDIVDAGPEYGNKGINRPMYVDAWKKGKTSRDGDKSYNDYEEIRGFLGEKLRVLKYSQFLDKYGETK